ncbi:TetR/AcrR family transcriptional regulator [Salinisphaera sp. Q1T1-3]|uniref:TetR/AcrR family transcriptional regulator n=1 Tax=Salinisphaera sp. Q1T1-3 TaxID=2321229 RepID=UPI000E7142C0|nr:TetR/AcrR family transcriptional regulator [Salinisphaera sp. Q1T1-3]RJS94823.1 TetR/AcrR family transcriptional regulator [Salinisphaera sp. Q1T1-3]
MQARDTTPERPGARERILTAARALFYEHGIRATGTNRLIETAGVTKVTFYRHFPSKDALVVAFLDDRHERWLAWFDDALTRHGRQPQAIVGALGEWFARADYRGCAFLNTVAEQGTVLPDTHVRARVHKQAMTRLIDSLLPSTPRDDALAEQLAMAVDGAIAWAVFTEPAVVLASLDRTIAALVSSDRAGR